jgi:hypothetical protein
MNPKNHADNCRVCSVPMLCGSLCFDENRCFSSSQHPRESTWFFNKNYFGIYNNKSGYHIFIFFSDMVVFTNVITTCLGCNRKCKQNYRFFNRHCNYIIHTITSFMKSSHIVIFTYHIFIFRKLNHFQFSLENATLRLKKKPKRRCMIN